MLSGQLFDNRVGYRDTCTCGHARYAHASPDDRTRCGRCACQEFETPGPTDCDRCHASILYGAICYAIPTGRWDGQPGDPDNGKPIVEIVCSSCYRGVSGRRPQPRQEVS